jgi:hypothetical protein
MLIDYPQMLREWIFLKGATIEKSEVDVLREHRSLHITPWTELAASSPPSAICNHLQNQNHPIEFIDSVDFRTPLNG